MKLFAPEKMPVFISWSLELCRHYQTGSWSSWCIARDRENAFDLSNDLEFGRNPDLGDGFHHPNPNESGPNDGQSFDHEPSSSEFPVHHYAKTTRNFDESDQDSESNSYSSFNDSSSSESQNDWHTSGGSLRSHRKITTAHTFSSGSKYFQEPSTATSSPKKNARSQSLSETQLIQLIYCIRRIDFTPLHMASLLGLLETCERLVHLNLNVNLASTFGTPLHCALVGPAIVAEIDFLNDMDAGWGRENIKPSDDVVAFLISSGSSCTRFLEMRFHKYSIASWSLFLIDLTGNYQIWSRVLPTVPPLDAALQTFRLLCLRWAGSLHWISQNQTKKKDNS